MNEVIVVETPNRGASFHFGACFVATATLFQFARRLRYLVSSRGEVNEQKYRDRPWNDEQLRGGFRGWRAGRHHQFRGGADDALGCGVRQEEWGASGRAVGAASGGNEPGAYDLLDKAFHGPPVQGRRERSPARGVRGHLRVWR